jgi:hypothetical protein
VDKQTCTVSLVSFLDGKIRDGNRRRPGYRFKATIGSATNTGSFESRTLGWSDIKNYVPRENILASATRGKKEKEHI